VGSVNLSVALLGCVMTYCQWPAVPCDFYARYGTSGIKSVEDYFCFKESKLSAADGVARSCFATQTWGPWATVAVPGSVTNSYGSLGTCRGVRAVVRMLLEDIAIIWPILLQEGGPAVFLSSFARPRKVWLPLRSCLVSPPPLIHIRLPFKYSTCNVVIIHAWIICSFLNGIYWEQHGDRDPHLGPL
jgi:hypothetical protein